MINQFGYAQSPFFTGIPTVAQRVVGLPIQSSGLPVQYVAIPVEAIGSRIAPTAAFLSPLGLAAHPAAYWPTPSAYGGLATLGVQGLPLQQGFGLPQSFGLQGVPISQWGTQATPVFLTASGQGLPTTSIFGGQPVQVPQILGNPLLQSVNWGGPTAFDPTGGYLASGCELLGATPAAVVATQVPRTICL